MLSKTDAMIATMKIKGISPNIAGQLGLPEIVIHKWIETLFQIFLDFYIKYGNRQFVFIISESLLKQDNFLLQTDILWSFVSKGFECFCIDLEHRFCLSELNSSELEDVCVYCNTNKVLAIHVLGDGISLYNKEGLSISFYNFVHPQVNRRNRFSLNARSFRDYKLVIEEQGQKQLIKKFDDIWDDRNKRILIANRKTEKILQKFLATWLDENICDARVITEVGKISGADRTDIELVSINTGDNLIIEVKWMGKNANGSSFDITRLEEGIRQVCTYLNREPSALEGCVVCYDGRQESEKSVLFTLNEPIARLDYRIIWLESKSGSEIGTGG
jgi:hypothetical protein